MNGDTKIASFLMYRVELKVLGELHCANPLPLFLMYRVELKAPRPSPSPARAYLVPNVPCGVESSIAQLTEKLGNYVPNVPCGVESAVLENRLNHVQEFLMYRVELKASS